MIFFLQGAFSTHSVSSSNSDCWTRVWERWTKVFCKIYQWTQGAKASNVLLRGLLVHESGFVLKPVQAPPKGTREVAFYQVAAFWYNQKCLTIILNVRASTRLRMKLIKGWSSWLPDFMEPRQSRWLICLLRLLKIDYFNKFSLGAKRGGWFEWLPCAGKPDPGSWGPMCHGRQDWSKNIWAWCFRGQKETRRRKIPGHQGMS